MVFGKRLNKYYLKFAPLFLIGIIVLLVIDYVQLEIPKIYRMLLLAVNTGYIDKEMTTPFTTDVLLEKICMPMLLVIAIMLVGRFSWRVCFFNAGVKTAENLRREMFDHAKELSANFYSKSKVGNLMSLFTNDVDVIDESVGWGVMMFFDALFLGVMSAVNMIKVQPILSLFCAIPLVLLMTAGIILNHYLELKWAKREQAFSNISDFAQESFSGLSVIKAFVKEAKELMAFKKLNDEYARADVDFTKLSVAMRIIVTLFVESVVSVILGVGGYLVFDRRITAEYLIEFIGYFYTIVWPVMAISELVDVHSRGKASLKRITALLDEKPDVVDAPGARPAGTLSGKIEFKNLTFSYPGSDRVILDDLTFTVNAGENIGVIGRIGSGKTTIADILARAYNVKNGTVYLDGADVNDLTIGSVRDNVACVPQDNFLYSDTIANNIAFAVDGASAESIREAARLSCVADDIEAFPHGYDTVLGERGVTVSGGQKQRISIARALLKNAPILVLDDSVSAVDTQTEKTVLDNIRTHRAGKTTIIIAHRISTVERLDRILFLENGKKKAFGTHEELLSTCAEYAELVELQKLEDTEEN